jgi:hypothetical protein
MQLYCLWDVHCNMRCRQPVNNTKRLKICSINYIARRVKQFSYLHQKQATTRKLFQMFLRVYLHKRMLRSYSGVARVPKEQKNHFCTETPG